MPTTHDENFIAEMKVRLLEEKKMLEEELNTLGHKNAEGEYIAEFPDYGRDEEDNATEVADYETTRATTKANQERLKEVEAALQKIEAGTYGITSDGQMIPEKRLQANPAASTTV